MITGQTSSKVGSGTSTPNRKTDQWHRLASVVRSSQKTFVSNSPLAPAGVSSIVRYRKKLPFKDRTSYTPTSTPGRLDEGERQACNIVSGGSPGRPAIATPSKTKSMVPVYSSETTPSKIRSLASSYVNIKQKAKSMPTSSHHKKRRAENFQTEERLNSKNPDNSVPLTSPYSFKFLIAFILLVMLVSICVSFSVHFHSHYKVTSHRNLSKGDVGLLRKNLRRRVYGQHIVTESITSAVEKLLEVHVQQSRDISSNNDKFSNAKMTVMSLHGWTGVGKTFVTQILVDSLKPDNFLHFVIPIHFPHILHDDDYKSRIKQDIMTNITSAMLNLIIFDEMDKASLGVLEGIRSALLLLKTDNYYKNSTVIVVFVSNTLGRSVNTRLFNLLSQGRQREEILSIDFQDLFQDGSHGDHGNQINPWYNHFSDHNLINSFIPFLPLDINHVRQCIRHNLGRKGAEVTSDLVNSILAELSFFRPLGSSVQYSLTGCKRVAEKVDLHLDHIL